MSPTDALIREIEALRPVLDAPRSDTSLLIRGVVRGGTLTVTRRDVRPFEDRRR
jgi:hypothetical protein